MRSNTRRSLKVGVKQGERRIFKLNKQIARMKQTVIFYEDSVKRLKAHLQYKREPYVKKKD